MIVVTGATGQLGRLVVDSLLKRGVAPADLAVAVRTPDRAADLAELGIEVREADFDRPETLTVAFKGADKLLLISANGTDEERIGQHKNAIAAAAEAGVGQIVYTSLFNAADSTLGLAQVHRAAEAGIAATGLPSVILRNGWYTENYTAALAGAVERGAVAGSAGEGRIAGAARADYAEAAAAVLAGEGHTGKVYELTGDTAWSLTDLAAAAAAHSGTQVVYADMPAEDYTAILNTVGLPPFLVELLVDADVQISKGALATTTGDLSALIGRPTTPLSVSVAEALAA
jgi:NAD(P)H dehydrogenase (quinone)